jgi:hypothetical protein
MALGKVTRQATSGTIALQDSNSAWLRWLFEIRGTRPFAAIFVSEATIP